MKSPKSIGDQVPIAVMVIVLMLVGQFNSFRKPLIILLTIPLGLIGVFYGLVIARSYFGFMTLLGIVSLAGIVINNAIVLLDRIRIEIDENGLDPASAVIEAAQRRLRPILLTTATTIGGLLPLWIGGGPMWSQHGHRHHLRPGLRHGADPGHRAGAVLAVLPGQLSRLRLPAPIEKGARAERTARAQSYEETRSVDSTHPNAS